MHKAGSLTIIDSASALSLTFILVIATFTQANQPNQMLTFEMGYYQKIAEQILLSSAMKDYVKELICDLETDRVPMVTLTKMAEICPDGLACRLCIYQSGRILNSFGALHDSTYGEARYCITLRQGEVVILCQVSAG